MRIVRFWVRLLPIFVTGCVADLAPRQCAVDDDCLSGGVRGACVSSTSSSKTWCAFAATSCASGLRWGARAGEGLADACVNAGNSPDGPPIAAFDAPSMNALSFMPPVPSFMSVLVGGASSGNLLVTNSGTTTVTALMASIDGADAAEFSLDPDGCSGNALGAGSMCTLVVKFKPTHAGLSTASLTISGTGAPTASTALSASATSSVMVTVTGPGMGTIVSDPPGISCSSGTCSHEFDAPTVKLTATPDPSSGFLEWSAPCSGDGDCVVSLDAGVRAVQAIFTRILCVDAETGDDSRSGDCSAPLRTITKAMTLASGDYTVQLAPGIYGDQYNGETMPIVVPAGVRLIGDEATKGKGAPSITLRGEGFMVNNEYATIHPASGATVAGLAIQRNSASQHWVDLIYLDSSSTGVVIRNNTLSGGAVGVALQGGHHVISDNTITHQEEIDQAFPSGAAIHSLSASATLERNVLSSGLYGVVIEAGPNGVDLGGGALSSAGNNVISCNVRVNVVDLAEPDVLFATHNAWDHSPPTSKADPLIACLSGPGLDFCGATLMSAPSSVASGACP